MMFLRRLRERWFKKNFAMQPAESNASNSPIMEVKFFDWTPKRKLRKTIAELDFAARLCEFESEKQRERHFQILQDYASSNIELGQQLSLSSKENERLKSELKESQESAARRLRDMDKFCDEIKALEEKLEPLEKLNAQLLETNFQQAAKISEQQSIMNKIHALREELVSQNEMLCTLEKKYRTTIRCLYEQRQIWISASNTMIDQATRKIPQDIKCDEIFASRISRDEKVK